MRGSKDESPRASPQANVTRAWREAMTLYSNARGMRPRPNWLTGIADRMPSDRVERLERTKDAQRLCAIFERLDDAEMRQFRTRAEVNLDQAVAAMRLSLVVNMSAPVGFILVLNQVLPGRLAETLLGLGPLVFLGSITIFIVTLVIFLWYCYAGVAQARDVRHLCLLEGARRGAAEHTGSSTEEIYPETDVSDAV